MPPDNPHPPFTRREIRAQILAHLHSVRSDIERVEQLLADDVRRPALSAEELQDLFDGAGDAARALDPFG